MIRVRLDFRGEETLFAFRALSGGEIEIVSPDLSQMDPDAARKERAYQAWREMMVALAKNGGWIDEWHQGRLEGIEEMIPDWLEEFAERLRKESTSATIGKPQSEGAKLTRSD